MKNKKIGFIFVLVFMIVLSVSAISASDVDNETVSAGGEIVVGDSVSGDVDVVTENPWATSGELNYDIPSDAKEIKNAAVYVNVYGGSATNTHGANANITLKTVTGESQLASEQLWIEQGSTDGTVYTVNNHTTKCYSDYMMYYDITNSLKGLNGTHITLDVKTFEMENKTFDGRIKLISLVLAYDDGDDDVINYWIDSNQLWSKTNVTVTFDTSSLTDKAYLLRLTNIVLSSGDGSYRLNGEFLSDAGVHKSGNYYQLNQWDLTKQLNARNTELLVSYAGTSSYGSIKNVLSVLVAQPFETDVSLATEYANTCYAGTNNTVTATVKTNKNGNYSVQLLADGVVVDSIDATLNEGDNTLLLTDPTVRAVDETTVKGANNTKVNYTVQLIYDDLIVGSSELVVPVLYNGNLGKDLAYPAGAYKTVDSYVFTGDIVVDIKDVGTYMGAAVLNRTDVWTFNLDNNSKLVKAFVYLPYNWWNPNLNGNLSATFNGQSVTPVNTYVDQSNLGNYGGYTYGLYVYDVTDLMTSGDNSFFVNKDAKTPAVYPSALVYFYNSTGSKVVNTVYIVNDADLLAGTSNNKANRTVKIDSLIDVFTEDITNATLYIFAAGAQSGEGDIVFNNESYGDVWSGTSSTTDIFTKDVSGLIKDTNSISFVATGSTILSLQQLIVTSIDAVETDVSLATEYANTCYAGTNNTVTATVKTNKNGNYSVQLLADGVVVDSIDATLNEGDNTLLLTDPTVRAVDETTVKGANNTKVNYTVQLLFKDSKVGESELIVPVLYNGNLGKDLAYPKGAFGPVESYKFTGDIVVDIKDVSTYMGAAVLNRTDVWTVNLPDKSKIVKAFVYVPYNWWNPNLGGSISVAFNNANITPVNTYVDQSNLGNYGGYAYGLYVYDVTDLMTIGNNSLFVSKSAKTPAVYPSALVYMYNITGSSTVKTVYITDGADLLAGTSNNKANRTVNTDSTINISAKDITGATLYVLAAGAQSGEGNVVFNGKSYDNVWNGTSSTTDLFTKDVSTLVKNSNSISFVATGSTILALQQFIVTVEKVSTKIVAPQVTAIYSVNKYLIATLKDSTGKALSNCKVTILINGKTIIRTTDKKGQAKVVISSLVPKTYPATIKFAGNAAYKASSVSTKVVVKKATPKMFALKKTYKVKSKIKLYSVILKTNKNQYMKKVLVTLKVNGKLYKAITNAKGQAIFKITKLNKVGRFNAAIKFAGNKYYNALLKSARITVIR
ncbi:DUF3344 domain-containing protein [uncultured Methanobrevibacter sp.]|uniref:DUF3344 domain-containing protein n=1 Tax=uncultured Methanobrevibacter sp. TaxID=253161 RepID=UPI0026004413|nr:DUF3344 domain-containing protein [uncultured Methanobrevibacter sp.]